MLRKIRKIVKEFNMLDQGERLVVAVSGGPDSVALLKALTIIANDYKLSLLVAHMNHGLRGEESDREEVFVHSLCRDLGVDCVIKKVDIPLLRASQGKSLEDLCRDERYAFLKETAEEYRATKIALGHNFHDQVETVLINFLRGSGSEGLRGILPVREGKYIRPLLKVSRSEILVFLEKEGLAYANDSSNAVDFCLRNKIRNQLVPFLKEVYNPRLEEVLFRTAEIMRLDDDFMELESGAILRRCGIPEGQHEKRIPIVELLGLHEALRNRVIKKLLTEILPSGKSIGFTHIREVARLAKSSKGSGSLDLPGGIKVRREYDLIIVSQNRDLKKIRPSNLRKQEKCYFSYPVEVPGRVDVSEAGISIIFEILDRLPSSYPSSTDSMVYMDYDALHPFLVVRNMNPGDQIQPLGMKGTKKLKALFIDEKIPRARRDKIPLLVDREEVLWVAGVRLSERARITDQTRQVLKVEIV